MAIDERYLTLMSSLPGHGVLFSEKKTPISRISLNQKLKQLEARDRKILIDIEALLNWDKLPLSLSNEDLVRANKKFMPALTRDVRPLIEDKINFRSVIGALRYRHKQELQSFSPETLNIEALAGPWTTSRLKSRIENHWTDPTFTLEGLYPWLPECLELIKQNKVLALEKLVLKKSWELIQHHQDYQHFSFKSVVIYVLKWNIVDRWTRYNALYAQQRYLNLIQDSQPDLSGVIVL